MSLSGARLAVLAMTVGLLMAAIVVSAKAVTVYYYCGYNTAPLSACQEGSTRHSWNQNVATGNGNGNRYLNKCERMHAWDDHSVIFSRNCGTGIQQIGRWADYCGGCGLNGVPNPGYWLEAVVGNNERYYYQNMYGAADYGT